jgi:hypothetical protein
LAAGPAKLIIVNAYGSSRPLTLQVLAEPDLGDTAMGMHSGDTGALNAAEFWSQESPEADRPSGVSQNALENSSSPSDRQTVTFWTRVSRVVDRGLSLMY